VDIIRRKINQKAGGIDPFGQLKVMSASAAYLEVIGGVSMFCVKERLRENLGAK
jgi:hypothetical protein